MNDEACAADQHVEVLGPVILNLANGTTFAGNVGSPAHPEWLELNIAVGGVTVNASVTVSSIVTAPSGTVLINGKGILIGRTASDHLTINNGGLLEDAP